MQVKVKTDLFDEFTDRCKELYISRSAAVRLLIDQFLNKTRYPQNGNRELVSQWRHKKTGGQYRILVYNAHVESQGLEGLQQVIYQSAEDGRIWIRPQYEFAERFEPWGEQ